MRRRSIWRGAVIRARLSTCYRSHECDSPLTTIDGQVATVRASNLFLPVYLPAALLAFGQGLLLTVLPLFAANLGTSYGVASLIVAAAALGTLITDVPAGAV